MLKTLVIIRLKSMFEGMFASGKKKTTTGKKVLMIILGIYIIACFGVLFGSLFASICEPFAMLGLNWLYFGFLGILVFLFCFIGSVFVTQNQLYSAKDNDLLLSMPIKPSHILASRLIALAGLNYLYELLIVIPAGIIYCTKQPITFLGVIIFILSFILLPLLVIALSALFGWIIAMVNSKMQNKNIITLILTLVLFMAYMYVCLRLQHYLQKLIENGSEIAVAVEKAIPPFYYLGVSIADGDLIKFIFFAAICIIPFALVYYVLSVSFIKIATTNRGSKKIKYEEKSLKVSGLRKALIIKESRHFLGNTMYMFNCGIGLVFMIIGAIYMAIKRGDITNMLTMMGMGNEAVGPMLCAALGATASLTIISSPTISLEGKTLWITKSSPIPERDALLSKVDVHILMSMPFIIASVILLEIAFEMSILSRIMLFVFPTLFTIFNALCGVAINLKYPKFDWTNETVAVKQALAPFLSTMVSMASVILPFIIYMFIGRKVMEAQTFLYIFSAVIIVIIALLYKYITTRGIQIFRELAA